MKRDSINNNNNNNNSKVSNLRQVTQFHDNQVLFIHRDSTGVIQDQSNFGFVDAGGIIECAQGESVVEIGTDGICAMGFPFCAVARLGTIRQSGFFVGTNDELVNSPSNFGNGLRIRPRPGPHMRRRIRPSRLERMKRKEKNYMDKDNCHTRNRMADG